MAFQFGFGENDDNDTDANVAPIVSAPETHARPVREHDLRDLVGMNTSPHLLTCAVKLNQYHCIYILHRLHVHGLYRITLSCHNRLESSYTRLELLLANLLVHSLILSLASQALDQTTG